MTTDGSWYRWEGEDLLLYLRIQPRAARDEFAGPQGDCFKVRITASPVEGKANAHLIRFLAKSFGVTQHQVRLQTGTNTRNKGRHIPVPRGCPPLMDGHWLGFPQEPSDNLK